MKGTFARTSTGRLAIFSEAVTTHASPAGRFGVSIRNAPTLTTHRTVAATADAMTSEEICSPLSGSVWSAEGKLFAASVRSKGGIDASLREGDPDKGVRREGSGEGDQRQGGSGDGDLAHAIQAGATTHCWRAVPVLQIGVSATATGNERKGPSEPLSLNPRYLALSLDGILDAANGILNLALGLILGPGWVREAEIRSCDRPRWDGPTG